MCNKTNIEFGFCDMRNYQGFVSVMITFTSTLIIPHITETLSNNCLLNFNEAITYIISTHI